MKRIIGIALLICMLFSCVFILPACGIGGGNVNTKAGWNKALNVKNENKLSLTFVSKNTVFEMKYDGMNFSFTTSDEDSEQPTSDTRYIKSGDKYSVYELNSKGRYDKTEITEDSFNEYLNGIRTVYFVDYSKIFKFDDFTLNGTTNKFEADEIEVKYEYEIIELQERYYNVEISFAGNKVSSIIYYNEAQMRTSYTFSYTDIVIEEPYIPVGPITNETEWNSALNLSAFENVTMEQTKQDGSLYGRMMWDGTNLCYTTYTGNITVGVLVTKEGDNYYRYQDNNEGAWGNKTSIDLDTYNAFIFSYLGLSEQYSFDDFEYNPTSEMYEADSVTQNGQGQTATINDVKISFSEGKINTLTYTYLSQTVIMTYIYDRATIDIPNS